MKQIFSIFIITLALIMAYILGYENAPRVNQSDWVLAYQHWYETSSLMLQNDTLRHNKSMIADLELARNEIDSVYHTQVMKWPVVCDQRDMLSDAIRCYIDNNPNCDLMDYVINFGTDSKSLELWSYSY